MIWLDPNSIFNFHKYTFKQCLFVIQITLFLQSNLCWCTDALRIVAVFIFFIILKKGTQLMLCVYDWPRLNRQKIKYKIVRTFHNILFWKLCQLATNCRANRIQQFSQIYQFSFLDICRLRRSWNWIQGTNYSDLQIWKYFQTRRSTFNIQN